MSLANLLKTSREAGRLSQEKAAEQLGVSAQTISNWETGRACPDVHSLPDIAKVYGISHDDICREYWDEIWPDEENHLADFPSCLFKDEDMETVSRLVFTAKETEFIRMLLTYGVSKTSYFGRGDRGYSEVELWSLSYLGDTLKNSVLFKSMPYAYVYRTGIAELHQMAHNVYTRTKDINHIMGFLSDVLLETKYGSIIQSLNIFEMPAEALVDMAHNENSRLNDLIALVKDVKENSTPILTIFDGKDKDSSRIVEDKRWQKHFAVEQHYSSCETKTDKKSLIDSIGKFTFSEWISLNSIMKEYQSSPYGEPESYIDSITASLTDKGEKLWRYVSDNPELFKSAEDA